MNISKNKEPSPKIYSGLKAKWEVVIGMEVHAQILSESKLFSGASTSFGAEPNNNVSMIDAAMPGMLPVLNSYCIEQAVKTGLALKAKINLNSRFDRKNYFYPDLPQGYQISQLYEPIVGEGIVRVDFDDSTTREVRIERIHLEQDAGKSIHDLDPDYSFVDLNRTGVALMEIVSKPDIRSPEEAAEYVKKLRQILRYLGTCDGNMQEGSLRADVNISVCKKGNYEKYQASGDFSYLGTRCEIKNMNSMKFIQQAIDFEAKRQISLLEDGTQVNQETRLFDPEQNQTRSMRSKEEAQDYRYFPCPDLMPVEIETDWIEKIKKKLPELPDDKKERFMLKFGVTEYDSNVLTSDPSQADFFENVAQGRDGKIVANWVINELFGRLKKEGFELNQSPISSSSLGELLDILAKGDISSKIAKTVFEIMWQHGGAAKDIIEKQGLKQVVDPNEIEPIVDSIIINNPAQVRKAKENSKLLGWFVGQVMKETNGKANPKAVNDLIKEKLKL